METDKALDLAKGLVERLAAARDYDDSMPAVYVDAWKVKERPWPTYSREDLEAIRVLIKQTEQGG